MNIFVGAVFHARPLLFTNVNFVGVGLAPPVGFCKSMVVGDGADYRWQSSCADRAERRDPGRPVDLFRAVEDASPYIVLFPLQ